MNYLKLNLSLLLWFFIYTTISLAQPGTPLAKIVIDEQGNVEVFDVQENTAAPWHQSVNSHETSPILESNVSTIQYSAESGNPLKPENPGPNLTSEASGTNFSYTDPNLTINVLVINNGTAGTTGSSYLGYFLSTDVIIDRTEDYYLGYDGVPSLSPWETSGESITVDLTTVAGLPAGTYLVAYIIDMNNQITEDNESDNVGCWTSPTITWNGLPDLYCDYIGIDDGEGPDIIFRGTVMNLGTGTADPHHFECYLSTDGNILTSDYLICTDMCIGSRVGGTGYSFYEEVTVSGVPEGWYYLGIIVDTQEEVYESNEYNNRTYLLSPKVHIPTTSVHEKDNEIFWPEKTILQQNFPNPFNPTTRIPYSIAKQGKVSIRIYNLTGKLMDTLVDEERQPGTYWIEWNAQDFPSGIYLYHMEAEDYIETRKLILQR